MRKLTLIPVLALVAMGCALPEFGTSDEEWEQEFDAAMEQIEKLESAQAEQTAAEEAAAEQEKFEAAVDAAVAEAIEEHDKIEAEEAAAKEAAKPTVIRSTGSSMSRPGTRTSGSGRTSGMSRPRR